MRKLSLKTQVIIGCILFTVLLTLSIGAGGYYEYKKDITRKFHDYACTIIDVTEYVFQENDMLRMVQERSMEEGYQETRKALNAIKERSDIAYIFGIYFEDTTDLYSLRFVINGATEEELAGRAEEEVYSYMGEVCTEGDFDKDMRIAYLATYLSGSEDFHYYENVTEEYGHMLTCYKVLHNEDGEPVCILSVDMDINEIQANLKRYLTWMLMIGFIFMVILLVTFTWIADRFVTDPVMKITRSADRFVRLLESNARPEDLVYENVKIHAHSDIRTLSEDVRHMAVSVKDYMVNLEAMTKEKERIGTELELATRIQADMLPGIFPPFPDREEIDIFAAMYPAKEVGGDFYDFFFVDHTHLALVIADVSGKGVPAALFMVVAKTLIKNQAQAAGGVHPGKVLAAVNEQLCEGNDAELFVTVWLAVVDLETGEGIASNAGHEHPAIRRVDGSYELCIYRHSPALAVLEGIPFREHEFRLNPGDSLFVYTDGVTEATNASNELFGNNRLTDALNKNPDADPEQLVNTVRKDINTFVGRAPQFDDITMLAFRYRGPVENAGQNTGEDSLG